MSVLLVDIEGTVGSIAFVKDVMFPWARERLGDWLHAHATEPRVDALLSDVRAEAGEPRADVDRCVELLRLWIDADRKVTPLKTLQGWIWRAGFEDGSLRAHLYDDAVEAIGRWSDGGARLAVYSSGSVDAQRLYFGHSTAGDLTHRIEAWFDTTTGPKRDVESYRRVAAALDVPAHHVCFLSDVVEELDAAREAGMDTVWVIRDGALPGSSEHRVVRELSGIEVPPV